MPTRRHGICKYAAFRREIEDIGSGDQQAGDIFRGGLLIARITAAGLDVELRIEVIREVAETGPLLISGRDDGDLQRWEPGIGAAGSIYCVQMFGQGAVLAGEVAADLPLQPIGSRR